MVYNTVDIVKRARQLADLENSDFISYNENVQLLNETYQSVYQKLINRGDKSFLKKLLNPQFDETADLPEDAIAIILPSDFYQLNSVTYSKSTLPILRRAKNQSPLTLSYDLVNDELIIYRAKGVTDIEVTYYPTPNTLYLPAPDKQLDPILTDGYQFLTSRFNCVLSYNSEINAFQLYNTETLARFTVTGNPAGEFKAIITSPTSFALLDVTGAYYYSVATGYFYNFAVNVALGLLSPDGRTYFLELGEPSDGVYHNCKLYIAGLSYTAPVEMEILDIPQDLVDNRAASIGFLIDRAIYLYDNYAFFADVHTNSWLCWCEIGSDSGLQPLYPVFGTPSASAVSSEGDIYFKDSQGMKCNGEVLTTTGIPLGVLDLDFNTGYGILVQDYDANGVNYLSVSPYPTTTMDFPQSFYYTVLSYALAIAYAIKQQKDISGLSQQVSQIEATFYDTIERDDNSPLRIANVYHR